MLRLIRWRQILRTAKLTDTRRVYVGNVPSGATEQDVRKCFEAFGKIEEVVVQDDPWSKTGRCALVCVCDAITPLRF